ncbi:MAG TPA: sarcosine oxidase subunit gamma family protein [Steroidobacteraceae bacterium]|jgi:methylglutamate dehydrogenase subunit D|nr:sarcosine oxidase subunit gamma family protein [Steroidobacteraceae bacterium]
MHADSTVNETSPFAGLPAAVGSGNGVLAEERSGLGIARIVARKGQGARLAEIFRSRFGMELPHGPRRVSHEDVGIAGMGPETWLAMCDGAGNGFAESLRPALGDCASVSDQSDAYAILRLTGPRVRAALAKLTPIDIHPRTFPVNSVAQTLCGYVNVMLWRLEDTTRGDPVFELWVAGSLAASLHHAISHSAAEFGFVRQTP